MFLVIDCTPGPPKSSDASDAAVPLNSRARVVKVFYDEDSNLSWIVRMAFQGESYGLRDMLTHDKSDPIIEFYEPRFEDDRGLGSYISSYYVKTLLKDYPDIPGLGLAGGRPELVIHRPCLDRIKKWLQTIC